jgi:sulfonate transport system substrate-binding protein
MHRRARFGAVPVSEAIAADQQRVADAFHAQGLIPRPIQVRETFWPV